MAKPISNPKVGAYIAKSVPFAQPVLTHLRKQIHKACPKIVEEMKWSRLFFLHGGTILCNVSGFKEQCSLGFWGAEIGKVLRGDGVLQEGGMGSLGRITSLQDLPADRELLRYLKESAAFMDNGQGKTLRAVPRRVVKVPKAAVEIPSEFTAALKRIKRRAGCLKHLVRVPARVCGLDCGC